MKKNSKAVKDLKQKPDQELQDNVEPTGEITDNSIQEFLEFTKLQNRILGKMLEKMKQPKNHTKSSK